MIISELKLELDQFLVVRLIVVKDGIKNFTVL